ncbi:MAG: hypothetical protein ACLQAT_02180 [Candidatus Binataceae bacterium]
MLWVTNNSDVVNGNVSSPTALVSNPGSDGISLREAVLAANNVQGPHIITFSPGLSGKTIALGNDLNITRDNVTVTGFPDGPGKPAVTINTAGGSVTILASGVRVRELQFEGATQINPQGEAGSGIQLIAGTVPGTPFPATINGAQIEDHYFTANGGMGVYLSSAGNSSGGTFTAVRIARNTFHDFSGASDGMLIGTEGPNSQIQDLWIFDDSFLNFNLTLAVAIEINAGLNKNSDPGRVGRVIWFGIWYKLWAEKNIPLGFAVEESWPNDESFERRHSRLICRLDKYLIVPIDQETIAKPDCVKQITELLAAEIRESARDALAPRPRPMTN